MRRLRPAIALVLASGVELACTAILGIGEPTLGEGGGGLGAGGVAGTGGEISRGGSGPGGAGGQGGDAGGGPPTCDGCTGTVAWTRVFGLSGSTVGRAVVAGPDGSLFVAGESNGSVDFDGTVWSPSGDGVSLVVAKLAIDGDVVWSRRFTGAGPERVTGLALAGDQLVMVGSFAQDLVLDGFGATAVAGDDAFVAWLDAADGDPSRLEVAGGMGDQAFAGVAVQGDLVAAIGSFDGELVVGGHVTQALGGRDVMVVGLYPTATARVVFASVASEDGQAIAADGRGGFVVAGDYAGDLDIGGTLLTNDAQGEAFVARLGSDLSPLWAHQVGGNNDQHAAGVAVGPSGAVAVAGGLESELRVDGGEPLTALYGAQQWLTIFGPDGSLLHRAVFGELSGADVFGRTLRPAFDPSDGLLVLGGWFTGTATFGGATLTSALDRGVPKDDWVAAKIAIDGTHFWSQALGDAADQRAVDLALLPSREIVLVGEVVGGLNGASCPATACLGVALLAP